MLTTTRPTLLLNRGDRVWVQWRKGTILAHSAKTNRYMVELDDFPGMCQHQKYIYRSRNELVKIGGE